MKRKKYRRRMFQYFITYMFKTSGGYTYNVSRTIQVTGKLANRNIWALEQQLEKDNDIYAVCITFISPAPLSN